VAPGDATLIVYRSCRSPSRCGKHHHSNSPSPTFNPCELGVGCETGRQEGTPPAGSEPSAEPGGGGIQGGPGACSFRPRKPNVAITARCGD
jgi:hypothetical protein